MFISDQDIQSLKAEQRHRARKVLNAIPDKDQKSFTIREKIRSFIAPYFETPGLDNPSASRRRLICGLFMGLPSEPNLRELVGDLAIQPDLENVFWALPRIQKEPTLEHESLKFYVCDSALPIEECLEKNEFGIEEPLLSKAQEVTASQMNLIFMPGLAFDKEMNRLGRGKAYYDRFLQNYQGLKVGVLFHDQIINENLVVQPHDIKMDWIITENCMYKKMIFKEQPKANPPLFNGEKTEKRTA
ncbi:MAG: 5-formyltetrahydrofolate cyclo-ligase [Bdellovibrionota bacterium]